MNEDRYVAAVEISSSKIVMAVGKVRKGGQLDILATEQEKSVESVKYGVIQNLDECALRMQRIIGNLEKRPAVSPREITGVYVGLAARSLRNIRTEVTLTLPDDTEITEEIIERLRKKVFDTAVDKTLEVIDAVPRTYRVGKVQTNSPKGNIGNKITGVFDLIVCRPEIKRNLKKVIQDKVGIRIEGLVVTALSAAQIILSDEEKRLGCMLVDMGAETTTVSIYKDGHMVYYATLPLGGRNISRDLTRSKEMKLLEEKAEEIKLSIGSAMPRETPNASSYNGIKDSEVSKYVVARSQEIVANILEQLTYADLKESDLTGGIVCIGGGSKLNGILDLLARESGLPVKRGQIPPYIKFEETKPGTFEMIELGSVLYSGAMNNDAECLQVPHKEELPVTGDPNQDEEEEVEVVVKKRSDRKKSSIFSRWGSKIADMFSSEDDDSDLLE